MSEKQYTFEELKQAQKNGFDSGKQHAEPSPETQKILATLKVEIDYIKKDIGEIKKQITNHLPTSICDLKRSFNDYKLSQAKISTGILVSIILMLIALLANIIISFK